MKEIDVAVDVLRDAIIKQREEFLTEQASNGIDPRMFSFDLSYDVKGNFLTATSKPRLLRFDQVFGAS